MNLVIRPQAARDVVDIADRLSETSPRAARNFRERVQSTVGLIADFPHIGGPAPARALARAGVRLFTVKRFRAFVVIYRVAAGSVEILRVVDGRRDLPELFEEY